MRGKKNVTEAEDHTWDKCRLPVNKTTTPNKTKAALNSIWPGFGGRHPHAREPLKTQRTGVTPVTLRFSVMLAKSAVYHEVREICEEKKRENLFVQIKMV